ncbi:hypothetical protein J3Q64DRAFT_1839259 [Phycomyces blakesleeanus]|uniref:Uncharacterized protein n=1 Tax=Phycomyces blakesleeanus TaxID=4837 RepID=A0ABR3APP2_PHYBL
MDSRYPPRADLTTRADFGYHKAVKMIVTTAVGAEASYLYSPSSTEWSNDTKSDVI